MKVTACSAPVVPKQAAFNSIPKRRVTRPIKFEKSAEPDYGKGLKQLGFVIGMSILGVSSIVLGTRGKFCGLKL